MSAARIYSRAVRKAADLVGGRDKLARTLQVQPADVESWLADQKKPPRELFLRVVDILIDESRAGASPSEPGEPAAPRESAPRSTAFGDES